MQQMWKNFLFRLVSLSCVYYVLSVPLSISHCFWGEGVQVDEKQDYFDTRYHSYGITHHHTFELNVEALISAY